MEIINHIMMKEGTARLISHPYLKAEMIARMMLNADYTIEHVINQYGITASEVHSALAYYYDNKEELDAAHNAIEAEIRANAMTLEKFTAKLASRQKPSV